MKQYKGHMTKRLFLTLIFERCAPVGSFFSIFPENFCEYEWTSFLKIQIKLYYTHHYVSASFFLMVVWYFSVWMGIL